MTKYNEIFKLHMAGHSNTAIGKLLGCSRKTVITVLKLANERGFSYEKDILTDTEIHRILHPSNALQRGYQEIDIERCIIQKIIGMSGNEIWKNYSTLAKELDKKPFSQTYFKQTMKKLSYPEDFLEFTGAEWWISLVKNSNDSKSYVLLCLDLFSGIIYYKDIVSLTPRIWMDSVNELFSRMKCIPNRIKFAHKLPAALVSSTNLLLQYYKIQNKGILEVEIRKKIDKLIKSILMQDNPVIYLMELCENHNNEKWCSFLNISRKKVFDIVKICYPDLPEEGYDYCETKYRTALINFHIEVEKNYYSIPFEMRKERFKVIVSDKYVEVYCDNCMVCVHDRIRVGEYRYRTELEHMPCDDSKIPYKEYSGTAFRKWANKYGENVQAVISYFLKRGQVEAQGYLACMSLLSNAKIYSQIIDGVCKKRLEKNKNEWFTAKHILNDCKQLKG